MKHEGRPLTEAERNLSASVFGDAIDYDSVRICQHKWAFFQPRNTVMAPTGHIHFHPKGTLYCDDFCDSGTHMQGLFIHEMTHVWQYQKGIYLPLVRHPFCRYSYSLVPGRSLERYGIEQQAEIVRHAFLLREGETVKGATKEQFEGLLPFRPWQ